jgi:membrane protease subunit HflK
MRRLFLMLLVIALGFWLFTAVTTVNPGEKVVVSRLGQLLDEPWEPGLHIGFPWGIDEVKRVKVDMEQTVLIGYSPKEEDLFLSTVTPSGQMLTGDHNIVNIRAVIRYRVIPEDEEIKRFAFQQDQAEGLVKRSAETVLTEWVSKKRVDYLLARGKAAGLDSLRDALVSETNKTLTAYQLGVEVTSAQIDYLNPPDEVKDAFDQVTQAATQKITRENEAQQAKVQKLSLADRQAYKIRLDAEEYARDQLFQAQSDAKNFQTLLNAYHQAGRDPYWLTMYWWEEMNPVLSEMNAGNRLKRLPDSGLKHSTFFIPLEEGK